MEKKIENQARQKHLKKVNEMQNELVSHIKKIDQLTTRQDELETETQITKKKIQEQQKYQKELGEREVTLNGELIQLLEK